MKKILLTAFSLSFALAFNACSDDSSSSAEVEKELGPTGGYGAFKAIDKDAEKILEEAVKGTDYESVTCDGVSTQVVAGTNYKFQCSMKDGKQTKDILLFVFEPLPNTDKPVQLTLVMDASGKVLFESEVKFESEDENPGDEGENKIKDDIKIVDNPDVDCDGCFGDFEELTEDDEAVFEKANKASDSTFVNPTKVSKQVVAGMNYKFMCELEIAKDETKPVILEVYKNLKGEVEITKVSETVDVELIDVGEGESPSKDCGDSDGEMVTNCDVNPNVSVINKTSPTRE